MIHVICAFVGCFLALSGCSDGGLCAATGEPATTVVLTFDDGPLPADFDLATTTRDDDALLAPLADILAVLRAREAPAIFFIESPGSEELGDEYAEVFAEGLVLIHADEHLLGYHAFAQSPDIWSPILAFPLLTRGAMQRDLDALVSYLDEVLPLVGLTQSESFGPIFRQPFGGFGSSSVLALAEAKGRGWTYRGFFIDSVDWTDNIEADAALVANLPVATDADHLVYTLDRLRAGALRHADRDVVDVLFHVNSFTARHLNLFLEELVSAFGESTGKPVRFAIPICYLETDDIAVDRSVILDAL